MGLPEEMWLEHEGRERERQEILAFLREQLFGRSDSNPPAERSAETPAPRYGPRTLARMAREFEVLSELTHGPDTHCGLCRRLGTWRTNRAILLHLQRMERDGYLTRTEGKWTITERGHRRLERLRELKQERHFQGGERRVYRTGGDWRRRPASPATDRTYAHY